MPLMAIVSRLRRGDLFFSRLRRQLAAAVAVCPFTSSAAHDAGTGVSGPHLPVLIVGAGPVGLVLSMLLTKFGIKCAVLEKSLSFSRHPQAHFINNRSMEIFRKLDGLAEEIESSQPPVDLWRKFIYCTSLSGSILGSVDHMQPEDFEKVNSPVCVAHLSQYKLVNLLLKKLEKLGMHVYRHDPSDDWEPDSPLEKRILVGHECTSIQSTNEGVIVTARVHNGTTLEERRLHCSILIASDGARSTIRRLVGVEMKGERGLQELISVHFMSMDLGNFLLKNRPGMLFFVFNQDAIGVLVAHHLEQGEFVLQIPYYPPQQNYQDFSPQACEKIISKLVGWALQDVQVLDIKPWVMHAEVAEKYLTCNNRVILVGDAAHRFPPAGGFGMNTGIQDVHNIAWKIFYFLKEVASSSVLQTYESERRPIAISNTNLSVENFKAAMSVPSALGLDPTVANSVHRAINTGLGSIIPKNMQKAVLEGIFSIGRAQLSDYVLNEKNPVGVMRLEKLKRIFAEGKSLQLQFPAHDLGFCYTEGALVADTSENTQNCNRAGSGRVSREYIPTGRPGSRLPHMHVKPFTAASTEETLSTLDLVSGDKPEFLLIIAPLKASYHMARVILTKAEELRVLLKVCIVWPHCSCQSRSTGSRAELEPWKNYIDVEECKKDRSWWDMCCLTNKGVLLVRPDEHIAWRTESDRVADAVSEAEKVLSRVLGL
ncbi:3-(3-hydroxy-phenyl)propionate/3-hydroxycinnamic acid hydroxylase [Rhynchospora pubera]|uniref:3-(3-hydroxy-phenyl)propionate/3-hydroxycinnamic acid hydroxylase n=1 Tax=Rhynchospora pubera TaxID=906938 RepID=A0AAV8G615_9POAL|nr:3-(3-hydroxy-phenyl)propionate/3-hydroxycinnamic acid hydroxylase [Rhynchospora pubera]